VRQPLLQYLRAQLAVVSSTAGCDLVAAYQLAGALEGLQLCDQATHSPNADDWLLQALAAPLAGQMAWPQADMLACVLLNWPITPGRLRRWHIRLCQQAFVHGWLPHDLEALAAITSGYAQLLQVHYSGQLTYLYALHRLNFCPAGSSEILTVFELVQRYPAMAEQLLLQYPDLLWIERWDIAHEMSLGPIIVASRGVGLAGWHTLDPEAEIRLGRSRRVLYYDGHVVYTWRPLPQDLPERLRNWLLFLHGFVHSIDASVPTPTALTQPTLLPLARRCPQCHSWAVIPRGQVGWPVAPAAG
jgi:hypothetical protein